MIRQFPAEGYREAQGEPKTWRDFPAKLLFSQTFLSKRGKSFFPLEMSAKALEGPSERFTRWQE
jgi:hypothetical protein